MQNNKIIRSICYFTRDPESETLNSLEKSAELLIKNGFDIQTKRICSPAVEKVIDLDSKLASEGFILSVGTLKLQEAESNLDALLNTKDTSFNVDLTNGEITENTIEPLFEIIRQKPEKTFNFTFVFNNKPSTPFFPSAAYEKDGFSVGLQPTDLSESSQNLEGWLTKMKETWQELDRLFQNNKEFLGIDSSA
jgi:hypothetical protein